MASDDEDLCIERACRRCGGVYMISLEESDKISPDAMMNMCDKCIKQVAEGESAPHIDQYFRQLNAEDNEPDWFGNESDWKDE